MQLKINFLQDSDYIYNLAFVRALLIKIGIENLNIEYKEKEKIRKQVLDELKNDPKTNDRVTITNQKGNSSGKKDENSHLF